MKQKTILILLAVIFVIILIGILWSTSLKKVNMDTVESGKAIFIYDNLNSVLDISTQDMSIIKKIFNEKVLFKDSPSCGFSDEVAVKFNDSQTFCFACDTCPLVYWKEEDMYFRITEEEKEELYAILLQYGFVFPCI